ncbi:MAG: HAD-IIB family hydrolase [Traorella sp.]
MKLFASDFDGTFYFRNDEKTFNQNIQAAKAFQKENLFVFVSGRSRESLLSVIKKKNLNPNYIIGFNGGIICDQNGNILYEDFAQVEINKLLDLLSNEKIKLFKCLTKDKVFMKYDKYSFLNYLKTKIYLKNNQRKLERNIYKLDYDHLYMITLICENENHSQELCEKINALQMNCNAYANKNCIDIVGKKASKQKAVQFLQEYLKIHDVYVIGDSYNDLCMIQYYHGFTLESANEKIKQEASKVFNSVNEALCFIE